MFENLSERLSGVFDKLTKQGALSEDDVKTALRVAPIRVEPGKNLRRLPKSPLISATDIRVIIRNKHLRSL